jgi:hypothetical protein
MIGVILVIQARVGLGKDIFGVAIFDGSCRNVHNSVNCDTGVSFSKCDFAVVEGLIGVYYGVSLL